MKIVRPLLLAASIVATPFVYALARRIPAQPAIAPAPPPAAPAPASAPASASAFAFTPAFTPASTPASAPASAPAPAAPPLPPAAPPVLTELDLADRAEASFVSEPVDPAWGPEASRRLRDAVVASARASRGTSIRSIACRESSCRVEVTHASEASFDAFTRALDGEDGDEPAWQGASLTYVAEREATGELRVVLYLVRPGRPAPYLDE